MSETGKYVLVGIVSAVVIVLDQITKLWIASTMRLHQSIEIFSWFDLTYVRNPGAALSQDAFERLCSLARDYPARARLPSRP